MRVIVFVLCVFGALVVARAVHAGERCGGDARDVVKHIFDVADVDGDGSLTREEYGAAGLERYGVAFEATDADADGRTTLSEYLALYERYHPTGSGLEA